MIVGRVFRLDVARAARVEDKAECRRAALPPRPARPRRFVMPQILTIMPTTRLAGQPQDRPTASGARQPGMRDTRHPAGAARRRPSGCRSRSPGRLPAGMRSASRSEVSRRDLERVQVAVVNADNVRARGAATSSSRASCTSTSAAMPYRRGQFAKRANLRSSRMAAISRMASAPWAAASTTCDSSMVKSFRKTGSATAARAAARSARLPWKNCASVSTESAAAPPALVLARRAGRVEVGRQQAFAG